MELDLSNTEDASKAKARFSFLLNSKSRIELKKITNKRTTTQNSALHKFFVLISFALNELGQEFNFTGVKGVNLSCRYTPEIVKECFWRPIQLAMFNIQSTKDINTTHINEIVDVVVKFFGDKGVFIEFPNKEVLNKKQA